MLPQLDSQLDFKEDIRAKRESLRKGIKTICFKKQQQLKPQTMNYLSPQKVRVDKVQSPRKRRNTSYSQCNYMNSLKDQTTTQKFEDLFEMGQRIGQGAHTIVYKCTDIIKKQEYAVKVTKRSDQEMIQRIKDYYRVLKSLNHQGIIKGKYLFINQKISTCHLVLEYSDSPNLSNFIKKQFKKNQKICEATIALILAQLLDIIQSMHQVGCCHRDIKPENILYDHITDQIKLIDFQIAKMPKYEHQKLQMMTPTGSLFYRAPQSFSHGIYNQLIDIWSVGVTAYELFTGSVPFEGQYEKDVITKICQEDPQIQQLGISVSAKQFLKKLLIKDPELRPNATEAKCLPFLFKNSTSSSRSQSPRISYQQQGVTKKSRRQSFASSTQNYYDQTSKYAFIGTIHQDIGIRVYKTPEDQDQDQ